MKIASPSLSIFLLLLSVSAFAQILDLTAQDPEQKAQSFWRLDDSIANLFATPENKCTPENCLESKRSKATECGFGDSTCLCQVLLETRTSCYSSCSPINVKKLQD